MKNRSKALLISLVIGALYAIYLLVYFCGNMMDASGSSEAIGAGVATAFVAPHMILVILAVIFNALGYLKNKVGFALTAGILYSVAAGVFILYAPFCLIEIIFSFIGYSKLKKMKNQEATV